MEAEYKEKLEQAALTGEQMVKEAVQRGQRRQEEILRQANQDAAAMLDKAAAAQIKSKASADIEMEKKKAINDAKNEISGLAMAIAGKVVERELNAEDQSDLIDRFINELGEQS